MDNLKKNPKLLTSPKENITVQIVVPDDDTYKKVTATLHFDENLKNRRKNIFQRAYDVGDAIIKKIKNPAFKIVKKKGLTFEQAYNENVKYLYDLFDQRKALAEIIENLIYPIMQNQKEFDSKLEELYHKEKENEERIRILEKMLYEVWGKVPPMPPMHNGKRSWTASMRHAAEEIIDNYLADANAKPHKYRHLRDASDEFYDTHEFEHKRDYTKDQLYANVKKENMMQAGD